MLCHNKKIHVFLVENTLMARQSFKLRLEKMGCIVTVASSYHDVLEKFNPSFDGVLTSVCMDDGTGFDVAKHVCRSRQEKKMVIRMYSEFGVYYIKPCANAFDVRAYFDKSFDDDDMENFVCSILENRSSV